MISNSKLKLYLIVMTVRTNAFIDVFYKYRSRVDAYADLEMTEFRYPVTDGKKCVMGYAKVKKGKKIRMASGMFDTWVIEPDLKHSERVFEKSENAKIQLWVTADERRIPVKVKSKVIIGSFTGKLVSALNRNK